jgi:anti-sigma B factor antagonist
MAAGRLQLEVQEHERAVVVVARGELDVASAHDFVARLERAVRSAEPLVVIDLSGLMFIDSSGLAALIKADHEAKAAGRKMAVVRGPHQVQQLLELTGLADRIELVGSLAELLLDG